MKNKLCLSCAEPCDQGSRTGLCRLCWTPPKHEDRFCGCGASIGKDNKSGLCKSCVCRRNHEDPNFNAKLLAAVRASNADPVLREKRAEACRAACRTPAERERRRELGKRTYPVTIQSAKAKARAFSPESIALRVAARLTTLAEKRRRREVEEAVSAEREDRKRVLATMSPFEIAMERVRQGAGISIVRPIPRRVEPAYTLGGVS